MGELHLIHHISKVYLCYKASCTPLQKKDANIDLGIHKVKLKVARNEKRKNTIWVFFFHKYGKFLSISLEQRIERKPLFSVEKRSLIFIPS